MTIKFATYNIQFGFGKDWRYDLARTQTALEGQDIICLQEVTTGLPVCNGDSQPEILAAGLNCFAAYAPGFEISDGSRESDGPVSKMSFGNMVLSRWPIIYTRQHSLPRPRTEVPAEFHPKVDFPRVALETVVDADGLPLRVISVHLTHLPGAQRLAQIRALRELVDVLPDEGPLWENDPRLMPLTWGRTPPPVPASTLVFGDFNFEPEEPDYAAMLAPLSGGDPLVDAWAGSDERGSDEKTCLNSDDRLTRLDYLFTTPDLAGSVRSAMVDQSVTASDHFPVYFELEF